MENFNTTSDIMIWQFTAFPLKSNLPQAKRNLILSIINFVHKLSHELPNGLRRRILEN